MCHLFNNWMVYNGLNSHWPCSDLFGKFICFRKYQPCIWRYSTRTLSYYPRQKWEWFVFNLYFECFLSRTCSKDRNWIDWIGKKWISYCRLDFRPPSCTVFLLYDRAPMIWSSNPRLIHFPFLIPWNFLSAAISAQFCGSSYELSQVQHCSYRALESTVQLSKQLGRGVNSCRWLDHCAII